jgi:hypothetical protein
VFLRRAAAGRLRVPSGSGSNFGVARDTGAGGVIGSGCNGHEPLPFSESGIVRGRLSIAGDRATVTSRGLAAAARIYIGFDDHVGRSADHQQMLDIVAAHQNEAAASVDAGVIDHRSRG